MNRSRVLITGSTDGLGMMAAKLLTLSLIHIYSPRSQGVGSSRASFTMHSIRAILPRDSCKP